MSEEDIDNVWDNPDTSSHALFREDCADRRRCWWWWWWWWSSSWLHNLPIEQTHTHTERTWWMKKISLNGLQWPAPPRQASPSMPLRSRVSSIIERFFSLCCRCSINIDIMTMFLPSSVDELAEKMRRPRRRRRMWTLKIFVFRLEPCTWVEYDYYYYYHRSFFALSI